MKIRLINRRPAMADPYEPRGDNIFTDVCEDILIQSPMIDRPSQKAANVLRPAAFTQMRRLRVV